MELQRAGRDLEQATGYAAFALHRYAPTRREEIAALWMTLAALHAGLL